MRTKISLFLIAVLCSLNGVAQKAFNKHFEKKSLRIDFALSGNSAFQAAAIQQLRQEPVWGGPVKNLTDRFNYGGYYVNLYDKAIGFSFPKPATKPTCNSARCSERISTRPAFSLTAAN